MTDGSEKSRTAAREEQILESWKKHDIFKKSLERPHPRGEFVFYEGPPTANAGPGIHHLEARAFKDLIPRYKTMQGYHVRRKGGWDTHGLPVELAVEKELGLSSKKEIEEYGVAAFNKKCKESVWKYKEEWERFTDRIGYWIDQDNPYITYTNNYIESLWFVLKRVDEQKLLYKDYKVVPWCPRCGTALSSHELAQGYKDVPDTSVYIKFKVKGSNEYFLAWTTTPWTLFGNVALAVKRDVSYIKVAVDGDELWFAKDLHETIAPGAAVLEEVKGADLVGRSYEPLFDYLSKSVPDGQKEALGNAFKIYAADFVTTDEGTGIVHTAVMYGQEDFEFGSEIGLPKHHLVDEEGKFTSDVKKYAGVFVKDADEQIIADLTKKKLLFKTAEITHTYPFCWRCATPLIYYARDSWYIGMSQLREKLLAENERVHWEPAHIKEGRFGAWLREVKDWAISRNRYWGTPLPVWTCAECDNRKVIGSLDELKENTKTNGNRYFVMRHGDSESTSHNVLNSTDTKIDNPGLTKKGKAEVRSVCRRMKKGDFDLIISSPIARTRQTTEIVAEHLGLHKRRVVYDKRLTEIHAGIYDGKPFSEYVDFYSGKDWLTKKPEGGESPLEVKRRMGEALHEFESKYKNKKILIVTHGGPARMLFLAAQSPDEHIVGERSDKFFKTAELRKLDFTPLPHDENYTLDFHRPYVDEVELSCSCGSVMQRVPEVMDVWFDSGAMPFAQDHYPFAGKRKRKWLARLFGSKRALQYPADFISEAIDQTRGWFYTLHAVGVLMGRGRSFKNVICLGHILDAEGKKMSKSIGNVVDPWQELNYYGADVLRMWMYSVNQPGESKNYDPKTVSEVEKKIFNILRNVMRFYTLYAADMEEGYSASASPNVLDQWIQARLRELTLLVTTSLDAYKVLEPARALRDFVTDLSTWYVRRSRDRFKGTDEQDKQYALATTQYVLGELAKLMAPFTPFIAEDIYAKAGGSYESVHLENWPTFDQRQITQDSQLLEDMVEVRRTVSLALDARNAARIKVRQPLAKLIVRKPDSPVRDNKALLEVIAEEVNVKEVVFENTTGWEVELDTDLTPELKQEGQYRELVRQIQQLRKSLKLSPHETALLGVETNKKGEELVKAFTKELMQTAKLTDIDISPVPDGTKIDVDGIPFAISLKVTK